MMEDHPTGFRFYPTEEERSQRSSCAEKTEQWFFFAPMQEREAREGRPSRSTAVGYWMATGSPGYIYSSDNKVIGMKKSMVFYVGKAPTVTETKWKLNEYRATEIIPHLNSNSASSSIPMFRLRHEFALCRVYVVPRRSQASYRRPLELAAGETITSGHGGSAGDRLASTSRPVVENNAEISSDMETMSMEIEEPT